MDWEDPAYEINKGLLFQEDERRQLKSDDNEALSVFLTGWSNAVNPNSKDFGERTFKELSWRNLGYRFGLLFDETPKELKEEMYYWCVDKMNS